MMAGGCCSLQMANTVSDADRAEIAEVIGKETDERILMLNRAGRNRVSVNTGHELKAFNSSGKHFLLKKTRKGWVVIDRGGWDS
jgi:hypothetical protein